MTILHLLQRIIEQLDELNEQQATVSDLTQALTDMQVYAHSQDDSALCNTHMHWRHWHTRTCPFSRITRTDASAHSRVTCARIWRDNAGIRRGWRNFESEALFSGRPSLIGHAKGRKSSVLCSLAGPR
jgi:hypothetical protein